MHNPFIINCKTHTYLQLRNTQSKRNGIIDTTNQLNTFVEAWKSAVIPIWIGLDFSDKGDTWGEVNDIEVVITGSKLTPGRHNI
jgi:hypothetical protein